MCFFQMIINRCDNYFLCKILLFFPLPHPNDSFSKKSYVFNSAIYTCIPILFQCPTLLRFDNPMSQRRSKCLQNKIIKLCIERNNSSMFHCILFFEKNARKLCQKKQPYQSARLSLRLLRLHMRLLAVVVCCIRGRSKCAQPRS